MRFAAIAPFLLCATGSADSETASAARRAVEKASAALGTSCATPSSDALRTSVALSAAGELVECRACLLRRLAASSGADAAAWGLAAAHFPQHAALAAHARTLLRGKACTSSPAAWDVLGPLPVGKNEVDADPLAALPEGGAFAHWLAHHNASRGGEARVASELVSGGMVEWKRERPQPDGSLSLAWPEVQWAQLVQSLSQRAVLEVQAWAMGPLVVHTGGPFLLDCRGAHRATLYDALHPTSPPRTLNAHVYASPHHGRGFSVHLAAGVYILAVRVRAVMRAQLHCSLAAAREEWQVLPPAALPDAAVGGGGAPRLCGGWVGLPVRSSGGRWLQRLEVEAKGEAAVEMVGESSIDWQIAPGQSRLLPLRLSLPARLPASPRCPLLLRLTLTARAVDASTNESTDLSHEVSLPIQCRAPHQSVVCTFVDVDGAITPAAVLAPPREGRSCDRSFGCPVLLTLHGTSITPRDSADAYKRKPRASDDEYTFGVEGYWLVAPSRHGAHNWEQIGRLSATRAVDALAALPLESLPLPVRMDAQRVVFSGHSMGGHGAWAAAVQLAHRALGVASVSGWLRKETYGDSNFLFEQSVSDLSASHVEPALKAVLEAAIGENALELHMGNVAGVPHLARVGADDQTVHPFWARRAMRLLQALGGGAAKLTELAGKQHWWWDTARPNDGGALNDGEMRQFFAAARGARTKGEGGARGRAVLPGLPPSFTLRAFNPASFEGRGGWRLLQPHRAGCMLELKLSSADSSLRVSTRNVRRFVAPAQALLAPEVLLDESPLPPSIQAAAARANQSGAGLELCSLSALRQWRVCAEEDWAAAERGPSTLGPVRQALHSRFLLVAGDEEEQDDEQPCAATLLQLAVYLSNLFLLTSDASPPVSTARQLLGERDPWTAASVDGVPPNHVLVGGPRVNRVTAKLAEYWRQVGHAASWSADLRTLYIGDCEYSGAGVGAVILGPTPSGRLAVVLHGDRAGLHDAVALGDPTIPPMARMPFTNTIPDYVVTGPRFAAEGYGGVLAAGFLDHAWRATSASLSFSTRC